eukprot:51667-Eustigmatos_ZCMA.PRE.1
MLEHANRGPRVEAPAFPEGLDHALAVSDVCHEPQLQLAIVRHDQAFPGLADERLAYLVLVLLERGLILQIGPTR